MMNKSKAKFYGIDSKGFAYCVPRSDLIVADRATVKLNDELKFSYGASTFIGKVFAISGKEEEILEQIKKNSDKPVKMGESFHADKPRKAAVKAKLATATLAPKVAKSKSSTKAAAKKYQRHMKDKAEVATDMAMSSSDSEVNSGVNTGKTNPLKDSQSNQDSAKESSKDSDEGTSTEEIISSSEEDDSDDMDQQEDGTASDVKKLKQTTTNPSSSESEASDEPHKQPSPQKNCHKFPALNGNTLGGNRDTASKTGSKEKHSENSKKRSKQQSSSSDDSSSEDPKQKENKAKRPKARRNMTIYPGQNYVKSANQEGVVKLHENFDVYVDGKDLNDCLKSKSVSIFIRKMVPNIYTEEALSTATPKGFPPRGKGKKFYRNKEIPPRLHPDGWRALIDKAVEAESANKSWRPKTSIQQMTSVFGSRCQEFKDNGSDSS